MLFIERADIYKQSIPDDKVSEEAESILNLFIRPGSQCELNLPSEIAESYHTYFRTVVKFHTDDRDIFEPAKLSILELMQSDTFVRYKKSAFYPRQKRKHKSTLF